ncbi:predicted protein [Aspergillus terreus NIH2624]|uniref:Aminoglycoside phosphotransferase domain-containing protein n=1 Tax=Aspergillus terreus (strain NIH 2624 / FGSC A1156) TaxID=341663 RepID=Q0CAA4_ASPTN|nr:uncharacterized protein ATEG_09380 [Aspergillus terreus NIH2624]EAU30517.1 predicted protein [Aspergillus terreus NIH2624]
MNCHSGLSYLHETEEAVWVDKVNDARVDGRLCSWISTFHACKLPCRLEGGFLNGSYNVCQKFVFEDGASWILRLPRVSSINSQYADEKTIMEVEALDIIHEKTTIPVPEIRAWGRSGDNPLGLGPFMIMDFLSGLSLDEVFTEGKSRFLKEDISPEDITIIYRQMANFSLQLFQIDFDQIGSLPTRRTGTSVPVRPLTWKVHDILHEGGVNTFGDRTKGFSSVAEYFQYIIDQDWQQLKNQPNSVYDPYTAANEYTSLKIINSLIPDLVEADYNHGPFKLICDDLGLTNLIIRSREDLTIVGVIDLEWVYAGPAQQFGSAPWWLLRDRPTNDTWDFEGETLPEMTGRYMDHLQIFIRVLEEEEAKLNFGDQNKKLSDLVKWSVTSGAMWLHMILSSGFFGSRTFPCGQLRRHRGSKWWTDSVLRIQASGEAKRFAESKAGQFERYDKGVEDIEDLKALMNDGKLSREDFVIRSRSILSYCFEG